MEVYRISQEKYAGTLVASGAANRWNKRDEFVVYSGSSISLSTLELVVHRSGIDIANPYKLLTIEIDDSLAIEEITLKMLPENWRTLGAYPDLQEIGSQWYHSGKSAILKVPSAVVPQEVNYIINTKHPDFTTRVKLIKSVDFKWDKRLL
jgi:RES domain-containing protein